MIFFLKENECKKKIKSEIDRLQDENQKQRKILAVDLSKAPQSQTEVYMQFEITRLTSENLVSFIPTKLSLFLFIFGAVC